MEVDEEISPERIDAKKSTVASKKRTVAAVEPKTAKGEKTPTARETREDRQAR